MLTDLEKVLNNGVATWNEIKFKNEHCWAFTEPATNGTPDGYLSFVPTFNTMDHIGKTYQSAFKWGYDGIVAGKWQGFNLMMAVGIVAGQSIDYPYIHMIPRRDGDLDER